MDDKFIFLAKAFEKALAKGGIAFSRFQSIEGLVSKSLKSDKRRD